MNLLGLLLIEAGAALRTFSQAATAPEPQIERFPAAPLEKTA